MMHVLLVAAPQYAHIVASLQLATQLTATGGCLMTLVLLESVASCIFAHPLLLAAPPPPSLSLVLLRDTLPAAKQSGHDYLYSALAKVIRKRNGVPTTMSDRDALLCPLPERRIDHIIVHAFAAPCISHLLGLGITLSIYWSLSATETLSIIHAVQAIDKGHSALPSTTSNDTLSRPLARMLSHPVSTIPYCQHLLLDTVHGYEDDALTQLCRLPLLHNVNVHCVGPLSLASSVLPPPYPKLEHPKLRISESLIAAHIERSVVAWLDRQVDDNDRPVVFVSLNNLPTLTVAQVVEFAQALLHLSDRLSFVWSLHPSLHASLPGIDTPRILLLGGWTPVAPVLCHLATRLLVTHLGINPATREAAWVGKPVVAWGVSGESAADLAHAARTQEQRGILVLPTPIAPDSLVPREDIVAAIGQVLASVDTESVYVAHAQRIGHVVRGAVCPISATVASLFAYVKAITPPQAAQPKRATL
ncbi:hypothetical protein RI367_008376 [Sorochytrium milnesiophthora]